MQRPKLGEIKIVTDLGKGDRIVNPYTLSSELNQASEFGGGVVELSARSAKFIEPKDDGIEKDCPDCPLRLVLSSARQTVVVHANGHKIPPEHLECAGRQLTHTAGIMNSLTAACET